jgi:hypothetical protein
MKPNPNPLDFPCTSIYSHKRNPRLHAENEGEAGTACPVHSIHPIRLRPGTARYWETVTQPHQLRAGVDWTRVWLHGERVEEPAPAEPRRKKQRRAHWGLISFSW